VSTFIGNYARYLEEINIREDKLLLYSITACLNWVLKKSTYLNNFIRVSSRGTAVHHSSIEKRVSERLASGQRCGFFARQK
jgi:hypothetical protein